MLAEQNSEESEETSFVLNEDKQKIGYHGRYPGIVPPLDLLTEVIHDRSALYHGLSYG